MSAIDVMTWRFSIAAVILFVVRPQAVLRLPRSSVVHGVLLGALLAAGYLFQLVGLGTSTVTAAGFITGMFVVIAPLLSWMILRDKVDRVTWLAVIITTIGLGLLSFHGGHLGRGEMITLVCAVMFALHIVGLGQWSLPEHAFGLTTVQVAVVGALSTLGAVSQGGPAIPPGRIEWLSILLLAVFATCFGYFAQTWAQSKITPTRTAVIMTMEPVFAAFAAVTIGTDELTIKLAAGALLILVGSLIAELGPRHSAEGKIAHLEP